MSADLHTATRFARALRVLRRLSLWVHTLLVGLAGLLLVALAVPFFRSAARVAPAPVPSTMEDVDWSSPHSSVYCLACHRGVAPAAAGIDVALGHPQNVRLSAEQVAAARALGTIVGPDETLICTTCHVLGRSESGAPRFMLADALEDSRLCQHCHPQHFRLNGARHDFRASAPELLNQLGQSAEQAGPCGLCHLAHGVAQRFDPCEIDPSGKCVACHTTRRCSEDLTSMMLDHPESHCVECHNPHHNDYDYYLTRPITELCLECHAEYARGLSAGMHPVGPLDEPVPQVLIDAGARVGRHPRELTCLVCHSTHTANHQPLLLYPPEHNALCLACHADDLTARSPRGGFARHTERPPLTTQQAQVVAERVDHVAAQDVLQCVSCHRVHASRPGTPLLSFSPHDDDACAACHPQHTSVFGTAHDLRLSAPLERNVLGATSLEAGACGACHLGHGPARTPAPAPGDTPGLCTSCHQPGAVASACVAGGVVHPQTECTDCHDPHAATYDAFLIKPEPELCLDCHAEQGTLLAGPHDRAVNPQAWPAPARGAGGTCLPCHVAHGGGRPDLYRFGSADGDSYHDDACLACHPAAGWNASGPIAIIHPHEIAPDQHRVPLALVPKDDAGNLRMGCRTCHDPHGGSEPVHLARVGPGEPTENLCLHCHADQRHVLLTGHSSDALSGLGYDVDSCKPCHAMHADRDSAWGKMLSPRFLMQKCEEVSDAIEGCVPCLACHHAGGPAPLRDVFTHPPVALTNVIPPEAPGFLPLFNVDGHVDPRGQIVCRTCHLAHGYVPPGADPRRLTEALTPEQQRARRFALRPFETPNLCSGCHAEDARRRFLYFHDPQRRKGPLSDPVRSAEQEP